MSIMLITSASLTKELGETVPDILVTIAKNSVAGLDASQIAELLGFETSEIQELQTEALYKTVRLFIASEWSKTQVDMDFTYDAIESMALKNLAQRVPHERDTETLLRIISVTNRAERRSMNKDKGVLDATQSGARIAINLTQRFARKLNHSGQAVEEVETRQISVIDGSAKNPSFDDIDSLLGVSRRPQIPSAMEIRTHEPDFELDDLEYVVPKEQAPTPTSTPDTPSGVKIPTLPKNRGV